MPRHAMPCHLTMCVSNVVKLGDVLLKTYIRAVRLLRISYPPSFVMYADDMWVCCLYTPMYACQTASSA
jgi:hypothetical protein